MILAASFAGWHLPLTGVAALIGAGVLVTLAAPREDAPSAAPRPSLRAAVIEPIRSFLARPSALLVLAFVALFKLGEAMAGLMTAPFYRHLGFDKVAIAGTGWFSLGGTLAGITLGGWLVARIGVGRALLLTGWAQTLAMAMYVFLSLSPGDLRMLYATVTTEAFAQGMADAAFLTFLSALCAREFAATQYALLSSVPQLAIHTIGAASGTMAAALGLDAVLQRLHGRGGARHAADAGAPAAGRGQRQGAGRRAFGVTLTPLSEQTGAAAGNGLPSG